MAFSNPTALPLHFKTFQWWHAVLIFIAANLSGFFSTFGYSGDFAYYNSLLQPSVAPPDWIFPIVWTINNIMALVGLYQVANSDTIPRDKKRRLYWAEGAFWMLYPLFGWMYFVAESPILGALNTTLCFVATFVTISAIRIEQPRLLFFWAPRFLWLCLAFYVSNYMALINQDGFFQMGPWF